MTSPLVFPKTFVVTLSDEEVPSELVHDRVKFFCPDSVKERSSLPDKDFVPSQSPEAVQVVALEVVHDNVIVSQYKLRCWDT